MTLPELSMTVPLQNLFDSYCRMLGDLAQCGRHITSNQVEAALDEHRNLLQREGAPPVPGENWLTAGEVEELVNKILLRTGRK